MKNPKGWLIFNSVMVVYSLGYMLWGFLMQRWWMTAAGLLFLVLNGLLTYNGLRRYRANRRADRNSGSPGPYPYSGVTTSGTFYSYTFTAPTIYSTGPRPSTAGAIGAIESPSVRAGDEPFKAWKWAYVSPYVEGKFTPINPQFIAYGVEDRAVCYFNHNHEQLPATDCMCGFYGLKSRSTALVLEDMFGYYGGDSAYLMILLEVEFYGRVIVHTNGYRAEKVRVLGMHIPDTVDARIWMMEYQQHLPPTEWRWLEKGEKSWQS